MKGIITVTFCVLFSISGWGQTMPDTLSNADTLNARVVLIGDAGELIDGRQPVVDGVRRFIPLDKKTTVVFLGDNIYGQGLPDDQYSYYSQYRAVLDTQVNLVNNTPAHAYIIPGNHDWMNGASGGYEAILRQQRYIAGIARPNVKFFPTDGCPGPVEIPLTNDIVLVVMDSQWWLHDKEKPGIESDCSQKTKEDVLDELSDIISRNDKKLILFACHHPFKSNGIHGGYYTWKQHIFPFTDINKNLYIPLPIIGSVYPLSRAVFGSPQDPSHPVYTEMINQISQVMKQHPYTIFLAGHEHNLQYLKDSSFNYIISGAGCKHTRVRQANGKRARYTTSTLGFATLEISKKKNVRLSFYTVAPDSLGLAYRENILNFSKLPELTDTIVRTVPIYEYKDSVLAPASVQYGKTTGFRNFTLGSNYRDVWSEPVMFKEFNINKEKGGFTIQGRGGRNQTKSLTLVDKQGKEWALRTIDKDPARAIPENLRNTVAKDIVQDMTSAAHPYAPLIIPDLARAVNVIQAAPQFYFVPDDPAFGYYRKLFANKIVMLESKEPVPSGIDVKSTSKVMNNMIEENDHLVDQEAVLRARLLDIVIGDWDRHFDQWKWAVVDTGIGKLYKPIAKDRDQAFFYSDGFVIWWASRRRLPFLKGFKEDIPDINHLGYSARDFDRIFLNGLNREEWKAVITDFQTNMTDSIINKAVHRLPREIYPLGGDRIIQKLKSRRDRLDDEAVKYFDFLSRKVNVFGSNKQEYFDVTGNDSGILVQVYAREKYGDTSLRVYKRQFDPAKTKEVRLYGFNGNDRFRIDETANKGIRFRMIGGRGLDTFDSHGSLKNLVYDLSTEKNYILEGSRTKNRMSPDPSVNAFSFTEFNYGFKRFPRFNFGFNSEDGPMVGFGFWVRTHGFRKDPYESDNKLTTLYSFLNKAYSIRYAGEFNSVFRNYDVVLQGEMLNPALNNFYGLGNETKRQPGVGLSYYQARYNYIDASIQIRKRLFGNLVGFSIGPAYYHYWNKEQDNKGKILEFPSRVGMDSVNVFGIKSYLGGKFNMDVNNLNSEYYPTRGVNWNTELKYLNGVNPDSKEMIRLQSDMTIYASLSLEAKLLAVIRLGGGHIFSKDYEYFQALNIGANNYLRGFRKNRFSGNSLAYGSMELRYKLVDVKSYVIPGTLGVLGFSDFGRVWLRGENSQRWHYTYGGGLFYLPYNMVIISATAGLSEEGTIFNFTFGTKLNLYY
jgi:hypothetical protein